MKTYVAARSIEIQSRKIEAGAVVGTGDVEKGQFTPAEGLERHVDLGHVIPRLEDGRIVEQGKDAPKGKKPEGGDKADKADKKK